MIIREVLPDEQENYNEIANHILQSYEWGIFREMTGVKVIRIGSYEGPILKTGFQLTLHPVPYTSYFAGYFPRGEKLTPELLTNLTKIGREHQCIFIKIEPAVENEEIKLSDPGSVKLLPSSPILPQHTFYIDLNQSEEEILAKMKDKTRYNIKLAEKHEVTVEERDDEASLETFIKLARETADRQGFFSHPADYYRRLWEILHPHKMAHLLIASYRGTPLSSIMLFRFKEMLYYPYGGSAIIHREMMPNHLLHWEAIKLGKRLGCKQYDLWGAYKNTPTEKDPWFGIYRFKEGFGGNLINFPQTLDMVFAPQAYKLYQLFDPWRFRLLSLKRFFQKDK